MECIICSTSMYHLFHEPMSMGCRCSQRVCQRCVKTGDVTKCPTCRKHKKQPNIDRKHLKKQSKSSIHKDCLGCLQTLPVRQLHKHEAKCTKYRNMIDGMNEEDARLRRVQAQENEVSMVEMEARLDLQADIIDDYEDQVEDLEHMIKQHEDERKVFVAEQARHLRTLDSISGPLYTAVRALDTLYGKIANARCCVRASRANHQLRSRQYNNNQASASSASSAASASASASASSASSASASIQTTVEEAAAAVSITIDSLAAAEASGEEADVQSTANFEWRGMDESPPGQQRRASLVPSPHHYPHLLPHSHSSPVREVTVVLTSEGEGVGNGIAEDRNDS